MADERQQIVKDFDEAVNTARKELREWLETAER